MNPFELLDIATADMAFAAYGKTKEKMFENAAKALTSIMFEGKIEAKEKKLVVVDGFEDIVLLQKFLSEIIYLHETEHIIFSDFKVTTDEHKIIAECAGEKYDPKKHKFIIDVKAVTYHKMEIKKEKGLWRCQVVVDV